MILLLSEIAAAPLIYQRIALFNESNCIDGYKLRRAKANSTTRKFFRRRSLYHTDFENVITGILYINTNNGGTKFKNGSFVKSVANRYVECDSNIEHAGVRCTDQKRRVVINFNFTRL